MGRVAPLVQGGQAMPGTLSSQLLECPAGLPGPLQLECREKVQGPSGCRVFGRPPTTASPKLQISVRGSHSFVRMKASGKKVYSAI